MNVPVRPVQRNENSNITQLAGLLQKHGSKQEQNTFQTIMNQMEQMDSTCVTLIDEITQMKSQMQEIQSSTLHAKISRVADSLSNKLCEIKSDIIEIKACFSETVQNTLTAVKEKGFSALQKGTEFLHLKPMFAAVKSKLQDMADSPRKISDNIEQYRQGMHKAKETKSNARRQLFGFSAKQRKPLKNKGNLFNLQKMFDKLEKGLSSMAKSAEAAEKGIERLQEPKISVKSELKNIKKEKTPKPLTVKVPVKRKSKTGQAR